MKQEFEIIELVVDIQHCLQVHSYSTLRLIYIMFFLVLYCHLFTQKFSFCLWYLLDYTMTIYCRVLLEWQKILMLLWLHLEELRNTGRYSSGLFIHKLCSMMFFSPGGNRGLSMCCAIGVGFSQLIILLRGVFP